MSSLRARLRDTRVLAAARSDAIARDRMIGTALMFIVFGIVLLGAGVGLSISPATAEAAVGDPVIAVSGDIACRPDSSTSATRCQQAKTGNLVTSINPVAVLPLGDSQYDSSTASEYAGSYNLTGWGTLKGISRPSSGNHEYHTAGATGYYGYFGANAGNPSTGYYSWDITGPGGAFRWHLIALNSECSEVGGCGAGSPQEVWLRNDLAANPNVCTIAYWHRPRFSSSSTTPSSTTYRAFWTALYNAGADVVLVGHAHDYERFAPQTPDGAADATRGLRQFVVGTGGHGFHSMGTPIANSVVSQNSSFGILKMTLHANGYDWQFMPAPGYSFTDSGTASCHNAPAQDTTPPSQPTGLTATAPSANQVNLSWTASTDNVGVKNYNIYRGANGSTPTLLATTTTNATTYTDTSVVEQTPYTYQVQAIDAATNVSQLSTPASVTTPPIPDSTPPTTPTNLVAEVVSGTEVDLSWTPSTDGGTGVSGYQVYRGPAGTTPLTLLATTTGTAPSYRDETASPNTRYDYQVAAFDGAGNTSGLSARVTAATPPGEPIQTFTFPATGDATIDQVNPMTNFGGNTRLVTDNSPVNDFLLKFNVNAPACESVINATLRLTNADGSVKGGDFYTTGSGWNESTVNWDTAPGRGVLLNSLGAVTTGTTYTVNVTNGVTTFTGEVDFRVGTTSSDGARYYSKEGGTAAQDPLLTVTCAASTTDTLEPTAPTNLTATAPNSGQVDLSWSASTDNLAVTGYRIYRGSSLIGTVSDNALSYQDITVSPNTTYSYRVTAVDAANNESPNSNTASATTPADTTTPTAPSNLTAAPSGATQIDLAWNASTDNVGVTEYQVFRDGSLLASVSGSTTAYSDTTVLPGVTYEYKVRARDAANNVSDFSNTVSASTVSDADTEDPTTPTDLTATAVSPTQIDLSWTASTDNVGVTGYDIYRGGSFLKSVTGTTASDTTVVASTTYSYVVQARDEAGNTSADSNTATATTPTPPDTEDPTAPTDLTATAVSPTQIDLSWTASTDNVGVTGYDIYRGGSFLKSVTGTSASDTTVEPSTRYEYTVQAHDAAGNTSPDSNFADATTPAVPPQTQTLTFSPAGDATIVQATPTTNLGSNTRLVTDNSPVNDFLVKFNVSAPTCQSLTSATLRLTNNDSSPQGGDFYASGSGWTESTVNWNTAPARGALLATLGSVSSGTTYTVNVTAGVTTLNGEVSFRVGSTSGNSARYYSKEGGTTAQDPLLTVVCSGTPDTDDPTAPTGLNATAVSSTRVDLSWTAATDNVGVTAYDVYRGGSFLKTVTGTSASDTTVVASTTYSYVVQARDAAGNTSGDSNTATVTTPAGPPQTQTFTFSPAGDATIVQATPTTNLGSNTRLVTDNSPVNDFLAKFNVSAPTCQSLTSATLRLTNTNSSVKGGDFYASGSGWTESTVNWNTAPARGALLATLGSVSSGTTYTVNVTAGVTTLNGEVSFRVGSTSGDGADYYSKEGGTTAQDPLLTVVCS